MSLTERVGRLATFLWVLAAVVVCLQWLREPGLFTPESVAARIGRWTPWVFGAFIAISLIRGLFLVPSTPVILAGGLLFPDSLSLVFVISMAGIVVSATVVYLLPGLGRYDVLLARRYPEKIERAKAALRRPHAFWVVAGWSCFPFVPTDVICYAAGLMRMSYRRMILAVVVGETPIVAGYLFLAQRVRGLL